MKNFIDLKNIEAFEKRFESDSKNLVAMNAATKVGISTAAANNELCKTLTHNFSIDIDAGEITNQKQSGR